MFAYQIENKRVDFFGTKSCHATILQGDTIAKKIWKIKLSNILLFRKLKKNRNKKGQMKDQYRFFQDIRSIWKTGCKRNTLFFMVNPFEDSATNGRIVTNYFLICLLLVCLLTCVPGLGKYLTYYLEFEFEIFPTIFCSNFNSLQTFWRMFVLA